MLRAWHVFRHICALSIVAAVTGCALLPSDCVPRGSWVVPTGDGPRPIPSIEALERATRASVVLLGEQHDSAAHHRWQRDTLEALYAIRPNMIVGFEMFPRRVQPVLDRWVAGALTEADFLAQTDWQKVWGFDAQLYMPLFAFARERRVPMVALNVERSLVREVGKVGFDAVPEASRHGVTKPAAPASAYVDWLFEIFAQHRKPDPGKAALTREDTGFRRFVEAQQTWDRAMAQRLAEAAGRPERPLVVGVMGSGHIVRGHGVPHQLSALGVKDVSSLLPWSRTDSCAELAPGYADVVFGAW